MKSKFSLSFGYSLIVVGVINIFIQTNEMVLLGLSISALIFSIISLATTFINNDKYEILYVFPFIILLIFSCYSDSLLEFELFKWLISSNVSSVLTFISFGLFFVSENNNYRKNKIDEKNNQLRLIEENVDYSCLIQDSLLECIDEVQRNNGDKSAILDFLNKIQLICDQKIHQTWIKVELLKLNKTKFSLKDFDEAYEKHTDVYKVKKIKKIDKTKK